jgi:hypothetical protein
MIDANGRTKASGGCPDKEALITLLYGEVEPQERERLTDHIGACAACASEMVALEEARGSLTAWTAPDLTRGFELVPRAEARASAWTSWRAAFGYAAAAALVLGVSAGIANLDVRYSSEGWAVRTGWSGDGASGTSAQSGAGLVAPASMPSSAASPTPSGVEDAWRTELAAIESRLRSELAGGGSALPHASPAPMPAAVVDGRSGSTAVPTEWVQRVQRLVDESEVRQQQNLALRIAEVSRDFELHRRADLVEVQQGLGQLGIDATQHKQMWDYFRRVSEEPR